MSSGASKGGSKVLLVALREYGENLSTKTFWIGIMSFPVILIIAAPIQGWFDWHELFLSLIFSIPMLATLIVGAIYWKKAQAIGAHMVSYDPAPVASLSITIRDIMVVAFSTAGVFILIDGVRELISIVLLAHQFDFAVADFWGHAST